MVVDVKQRDQEELADPVEVGKDAQALIFKPVHPERLVELPEEEGARLSEDFREVVSEARLPVGERDNEMVALRVDVLGLEELHEEVDDMAPKQLYVLAEDEALRLLILLDSV